VQWADDEFIALHVRHQRNPVHGIHMYQLDRCHQPASMFCRPTLCNALTPQGRGPVMSLRACALGMSICAFDDDEHWHRPDRFGLRCRFVPPPLASVTCEYVEMWAANHAQHAFPACLTTARHEPPLCLRDESAEPAALHCVIGTCTTSERSSGTRTCAGSS
jgi:hypothetical protein